MLYKLRRRGGGSPQEIISDLQRVAQLRGRATVTQREYEEHGDFSVNRVVQICGDWNKALQMANCSISHQTRTNDDCLRGIKTVWDKLGRQPLYVEYRKMAPELGVPCVSTVEARMRSWGEALLAFKRSIETKETPPATETDVCASIPMTRGPSKTVHACGEPIGFEGMIYAPVNELGVVALFGMLAKELGFVIECMGSAFPDCAAKRRDPRTGRLNSVLIEIEFRSSNFPKHKHAVDGCAFIVCWEHDWKESPSTIEVISLKNYLRERGHQGGGKASADGPPSGVQRLSSSN